MNRFYSQYPDTSADVRSVDAGLSFERLKSYVIEQTGLDYYMHRSAEFAKAVKSRKFALGSHSDLDYLNLLRNGAEGENELRKLVPELTVSETFFNRHAEQFEALRNHILPEFCTTPINARTLRVWSAGCSIGPEPYSLAILFEEVLGDHAAENKTSILATDIDQHALATAREGLFGEWAFRSCSKQFRKRHFIPEGNAWRILKKFRHRICFQFLNLACEQFPFINPDFHHFNIILCRNVMMYFDSRTRRRLVDQFHSHLTEGGYLLVGPSELDRELFSSFEILVTPGAVIYRKPTSHPRVSKIDPVTRVKRTPDSQQDSPEVRSFAICGKPETNHLCDPAATIQRMADQGDIRGALSQCDRWLQKRALAAPLHYLRGILLDHIGAARDAEKAMRRAIQLDRQFALAHHHLGRLLFRLGNHGAARQAFAHAISVLEERDPNDEFAEAKGLRVIDLINLVRLELKAIEKEQHE